MSRRKGQPLPDWYIRSVVINTFARADSKAPPPRKRLLASCCETIREGFVLSVNSKGR